jgi:hypothetical protein
VVGVTADEPFEVRLSAAVTDLEKLVRRLRSLSPAAWRDRGRPVRETLSGLVALSSELEGRPLETPEVADHVLADAVAVIGGDVLSAAASGHPAALSRAQELISSALNDTR